MLWCLKQFQMQVKWIMEYCDIVTCHLQVVIVLNYNTVPDFHTTNDSMLISLFYLHQPSWIHNTGTIKISLNHTLLITLYYNAHKVLTLMLNLHRLTSCTLLYTWFQSALLVWLHRYYLSITDTITITITLTLTLTITITVCLGILLTYIAKGWTSTNSKHVSRDPYQLLLCDITAPAPAAIHMENTACSTVACWLTAAEMCLPQHCIAMGAVWHGTDKTLLSLLLPIFTSCKRPNLSHCILCIH
jgi:hypothetical protein